MSATVPPPDAWSEWGGGGPRLVFSHANGFPPATYGVFFHELKNHFEVMAFAARIRCELQKSTVLEIPDATHYLPMNRPVLVAESVVDWYRRIGENG